MRKIYCNMCRKEIVEPVKDKNFHYVCEYTLCSDCVEAIDDKLQPNVLMCNPYSADWYKQELMSFLRKSCSFGRP